MSHNFNVSNNDRDWNKDSLIELSNNLGKAYSPGLNVGDAEFSSTYPTTLLNNSKSNRKDDSWNARKFIEMSRHLSSAYGVDF
ncbi:MAG: hypothetical protein AAFR62_19415 [Cyanobacteria bacterium J06629_2]